MFYPKLALVKLTCRNSNTFFLTEDKSISSALESRCSVTNGMSFYKWSTISANRIQCCIENFMNEIFMSNNTTIVTAVVSPFNS